MNVEDAEATYRHWYENDRAVISVETGLLEFRSGRALMIDSQWQDGSDAREFIYSDDARWFLLGCMTYGSSPDDRWLHIAKTLVLQPGG